MPDVVIFEGTRAQSPVEEMLVRVRHAALADNIDKFLSLPRVDRVFLVTNQPGLEQLSNDPRFCIEINNVSPMDFQFGRELLRLVAQHQIKELVCLGGAAVPLITAGELSLVLQLLGEKEGRFVTNNVQSADIIAFNPATVLCQYPPPATDNALAMLLRYDAGFEQVLLPATLGTQFDIDTPGDVLVLAASPFGGPHLRSTLQNLSLDVSEVERLKHVLRGEYRELVLAGRVGAPAIARLNSHFKVRLRVFSEERGMKALGRLDRGEVVSLLGCWLEECGPEHFFARLAAVADAALIDTRVIFAHMKRELSDADRFYSDLGCHLEIRDQWVKEFTRAAANCPIPVLLGGHSLVAGCIWAFTEEIGCLV